MINFDFIKVIKLMTGDFISTESFYQLIIDYNLLFVIGVITLSFTIIKRNALAFFIQWAILFSLWFQHWLSETYFLLFLVYDWFAFVNGFLFSALGTIQILSLIVILYEIRSQIKRETKQ